MQSDLSSHESNLFPTLEKAIISIMGVAVLYLPPFQPHSPFIMS